MASITWTGHAAAIKQVDTITIANTWAADDTCTLTINSKDLVVTIGSLVTTAQVATTIRQAIENIAFTDSTASMNLDNGKNDFPELSEVVATVSGAVVTLTAKKAGRPFTISVTETTAGNGTATEATAPAATGPNHWNAADNCSGAAVPSSDDTLYFDGSGNSDLLYSLTTGLNTITLVVNKSYAGNIGLPHINAQNPLGVYEEYRETHLRATDPILYQGDGAGPNKTGRVFIRGTTTCDVNIISTGPESTVTGPATQVFAPLEVTGFMRSGSVALGYRNLDTTKVGAITVMDGSLHLGNGCLPISSAVTITIHGGTILIDQRVGVATPIDLAIFGGIVTANGGSIGIVSIDGDGWLKWNTDNNQAGSDQVTLRGNGHLDFSEQDGTVAINTIERYSGSSRISDPHKAVSSLVIDNNGTADVSRLNIGSDFKLTRAAVS